MCSKISNKLFVPLQHSSQNINKLSEASTIRPRRVPNNWRIYWARKTQQKIKIVSKHVYFLPSIQYHRSTLRVDRWKCGSARSTNFANRPTLHVVRFATCVLKWAPASRISGCFASSDAIGQCCGRALHYILHELQIDPRREPADLRHMCRPPHWPIASDSGSCRPMQLAGTAWAYFVRTLERSHSHTSTHTNERIYIGALGVSRLRSPRWIIMIILLFYIA